jgi:methylated-DNA-[protein]-cysteine S-methyltransferase
MGEMCLAASRRGLVGAWFVNQAHLPDHLDGQSAWPRVAADYDKHPVLRQATEQLTSYFAGQRKTFELTLDINGGTLFQQSVWRALSNIPFGTSSSYGDISRQIGNPKAVRAVGAAVGRNPLSLIVPCHRVLGGDGSLTGYAGGLDRKVALLKLEGVAFQPQPPARLISQPSLLQASLL